MPISQERRKLRARLGNTKKHGTAAELQEVRAEFVTVTAQEYIASISTPHPDAPLPPLDVARLRRIVAPAVARIREMGGDV